MVEYETNKLSTTFKVYLSPPGSLDKIVYCKCAKVVTKTVHVMKGSGSEPNVKHVKVEFKGIRRVSRSE